MDVEIKVASFEDLAAIVSIERQCFTSEAFSVQYLSCLLSECNSVSLVARVDGCIVGFVMLQLEDDGEMVFGHIVTLNVVVDFRRRGIAQKLLFRCEKVLRLHHVKECRLEVRQNNYAALELYKRMGYEEVRLLKRYYGREHGLYLKKKI